MIILISGSSHTGKTLLAQRLLEKYNYPYLSIDHLKMGLIRSKNTYLTPEDSDEKLIEYLWPIVREIIKTNIENDQNLIVEGCYIPFNYKEYFKGEYLDKIKYVCLIMTNKYIDEHYNDIVKFENRIEKRPFRRRLTAFFALYLLINYTLDKIFKIKLLYSCYLNVFSKEGKNGFKISNLLVGTRDAG